MIVSLTPEHLAWRRLGVCSTDAARIMAGASREVWAEKRGLAESRRIMGDWDWALKAAMERLQMEWHEHKTGLRVIRNEQLVSRAYPFMRASLDGRIEVTGEPIDAKHISPWAKPTPVEWAVQKYYWQMIHQAIVCGVDQALLSIGVGDKEPVIQLIECDPYDRERLISACREFWGYVERGEEPPGDGPGLTGEHAPVEIKKLRTVQLEDEWKAEWPNWGNQMVELFGKFAGTYAAAAANAISKTEIRELLPEDVGLVTRGNIKVARDKAGAVRMSIRKERGDDVSA